MAPFPLSALITTARAHAKNVTSLPLQDSRLRDVGIYLRYRLGPILQESLSVVHTEGSTGVHSQTSQKPLRLANLSIYDLVDVTMKVAEWAEACKAASESDLAALASFWAASLHTVMTRKACDDAKQAVDLGDGLPPYEPVQPTAPVYSRQGEIRTAVENCKKTYNDTGTNNRGTDIVARRQWTLSFATRSFEVAKTCERVGGELLFWETQRHVRMTHFESIPILETC